MKPWHVLCLTLLQVEAWNVHWNSHVRPKVPSMMLLWHSKPPCAAAEDRRMSTMDPLERSMSAMGLSDTTVLSIRQQLADMGLQDSSELALLASDFVDRPEVFATVLQTDFGFSPLLAHRTRAIVMQMLASDDTVTSSPTSITTTTTTTSTILESDTEEDEKTPAIEGTDRSSSSSSSSSSIGNTTERILFKSVLVNEHARRRHSNATAAAAASGTHENYVYGLPSNYRDVHPTLAVELDDYFTFMTRPFTASQEDPIRQATADVYLRHAKLYLGWYLGQWKNNDDHEHVVNGQATELLSLFTIVPDKSKESAGPFLEFVLWLRSERHISVSYEANVLRGLTKLLKFRFSKESSSDPTYGEKSFQDVPLIRELRKLHRDANKRQALAPRSSDEERKWLSWNEYLSVIEGLKTDLGECIDTHEASLSLKARTKQGRVQIEASKRRIATMFQHYLILTIFASVPDRQRTIRELELARSFVKDEKASVWAIKHGPDDYKTGATYGDRPPLVLPPELVPDIDDFLDNWRSCLRPSTDHVFVQPRTGNPLTQDSVYQIVARSCFKYTGKRTNPHLLRDMIVTHVRESDASEKQLEALALFMGHSIQMQRTSYDRRTLTKKVAPAVDLLKSVNQRDSTR